MGKVGTHYHAIISSDTKEGDKAYPYGHTQVYSFYLKHIPKVFAKKVEIQEPTLTIEPNKDKPARKSHEDPTKDHKRGRNFLKLKVQDQKDNHQCQWHHNAKRLFSANLVFISPREFITEAFGHAKLPVIDFILNKGLGIFYYIHFGKTIEFIEKHIANKEGIFTLYYLRPLLVTDIYQLI